MATHQIILKGKRDDIEEDRFWSQARVLIAIAVLSFVAFFIKWVLA